MSAEELDDIPSMVVFATVAELGSFTAAAARLGLVKSVASARVARLERTLGVKLLHRTTRRVTLTPAGAALYPSCASVARAASEVRACVGADTETPRGRLRVNAPVAFGTRWLAPVVARFAAAHPLVHVDLHMQDDYVDATQWDVVIRMGSIRDPELVARKFTSMECGVFASPAYLAARGTPRQPLDLPAHACLRYGNVERHAEYGFLTEEGVLPVPVVGPITSNDGGALVALAEQGAGVVVVPWFLAHDAVRAGRLVRILPEARLSSVAGHAVHAHGRHAPARVRAFVDAVVDAFRAPPWGSLS